VIWKADPLEAFGGFPDLEYHEDASFPSPFKANASVSWKTRLFQTTKTANTANVDVVIAHEEIDWEFIRSIYGWAAIQYESWARGVLYNNGDECVAVAIHAPGIIDLVIDGANGTARHFGVDFYGFRRAPIVVKLKPGQNVVNLRLIRDVRAHGGQMPPMIEAFMEATVLEGYLSILENSIVVPDVSAGQFVSEYASLAVVNHGPDPVYVESIIVNSPDRGAQTTTQQLWVASGQSRPLCFELSSIRDPSQNLVATISYRLDGKLYEIPFPFQSAHRGSHEAQRFTFLHPSGDVSYAVLLPPSKKIVEKHSGPLPVLVALHGSGVDVDSYQIKHSFDGAPDLPAWLLFPAGMSPWCGDDWHTWGMADIDAALEAVHRWLDVNGWTGPGVITDRFLIAGHSNGGHGTWNYALKRPDRIMAAAPASGYVSVENYVPQSMWEDVDPALFAVMAAARAPYKQELFLGNMKGKPMLVQHGELDDNVPAYHSRLMKANSAWLEGTALTYAEIPAKLHWWDGAMTSEAMLQFYLEQLMPPLPSSIIPKVFSFTVADVDEFGSLHGLRVEQVLKPDNLAHVSVDTRGSNHTAIWQVSTRNVRRLSFAAKRPHGGPGSIVLDGSPRTFAISDSVGRSEFVFDGEQWHVDSSVVGDKLKERRGRQRGPMDAILRTRGPFQIVRHIPGLAEEIALEVSRNILQYFGASSSITDEMGYANAVETRGNVISIAIGTAAPPALIEDFPIKVDNGTLRLRMKSDQGSGRAVCDAVGAAWLQPLSDERLELVFWGASQAGLRQAARLMPTITGAGQPSFVVFQSKKVDGDISEVAAAGFFDYAWEISAGSYVPS
jgi:predicted esterase